MAVSPGQPDALKSLRERSRSEGDLFWIDPEQLAVLDPAGAQILNNQNFSDLALPDKLTDLLLRREGTKVYWQRLRDLWLARTRELMEQEHLAALAGRMEALLAERTERRGDLIWVIQEVFSRALIPMVVGGLDASGMAQVQRDQDFKIRQNVGIGFATGFGGRSRETWAQLRTGWVVRRELQGRAAGRRPRRLDYADPIVDLLPELGIGRAVDAVTGVLTAIGGPPGGAASCLAYALVRHPQWQEQLEEELSAIPLAELCAAPTRAAPKTSRVVRESLRLWTPTAILGRPVRKHLEYRGHQLRPGQDYFVSPDLLHHDARYWKNPDTFDPDRWLEEAGRCPHVGGPIYVPFGWNPRSCIGAGVGMAQLILFCHLVCVGYRIEVDKPEDLAMALPGMPIPQNFTGRIVPRSI